MTDGLFFTADHPVTVRWTSISGDEVIKPGRLHRVSESAVSIMLRQAVETADGLKVGEQICAEAGDHRGGGLAVFRGSVRAIESRLIKIAINGGVDVQDRRRFRRAQVPFNFASAILLGTEGTRYFLAHPVDISAGGLRMIHRVHLEQGDRFRLLLRIKRNTTISPIAQVIETWEPKLPPTLRRRSTQYVSRASFIGLLPHEQSLIRSYVMWLLRPPTSA
jgi:hypothetical protein